MTACGSRKGRDGLMDDAWEWEARVEALEAELDRVRERYDGLVSASDQMTTWIAVLEGRQERLRAIAERPNGDGFWLPEWVRRELRAAYGLRP